MAARIRTAAETTLLLALPPALLWLTARLQPSSEADWLVVAVAVALACGLVLAAAGRAVAAGQRLLRSPESRRGMATAVILVGSLRTAADGATDPGYLPLSPTPAEVPFTPPAVVPASPEPAPAPEPAAGTHRVVPGDNFWRIARAHLQKTWDRPPDNAEVARYWRQVIALNRERLRSGDPDLIFPGEIFDLPDPGLAG
jgi:nucleoid-associated protein YgaU